MNDKEVYNNHSIEVYWETYKDLDCIYAKLAKVCGLSEGEYWTLIMIKEGCSTQSEIRDQLPMNKQTIHSAIKQLIKKGLIRLEIKEGNQREKQILVTEEGQDFIKRYIDSMLQLEKNAWNAMDKEEQRYLIRVSQRYNTLLESELEKYLKSVKEEQT